MQDQEARMLERSQPQREALPVPDITAVGLATYGAKERHHDRMGRHLGP